MSRTRWIYRLIVLGMLGMLCTETRARWPRRRAARPARPPLKKPVRKPGLIALRRRVNTPWEKKADLNNDGYVDWKERRLAWRRVNRTVNTALERKYDANGNGVLEPAEARKLLQDRYRIITTDGKAIVDSELEKEYDVNEDGVIDRAEAAQLKADLDLP